MIKFLLRLPAVVLTIVIMDELGYGDLAQIVAGTIAAFLMEALICALSKRTP